ncbi:MAG: hypothetical protein QXF82_06420 [Nitrososphaeria archaeon]
MNVLFLSETPLHPSSIGKVTAYLASGLAERGHRVAVAPYSLPGSLVITGSSRRIIYNMREWAEKGGEEAFADLYPDADILVVPWGKSFPFFNVFDYLPWRPDAVFVYSYPYIELDLNDVITKVREKKGIPGILYALHEGPLLFSNQALSISAYSCVAFPTKAIKDVYIEGFKQELKKMGKVFNEWGKFTLLHHPINHLLFNPKIKERIPEPKNDYGCRIVGMLAKNHIRKDYFTLLKVVAELKKEGKDVCAGLYWINTTTDQYWNEDGLRLIIGKMLKVDPESIPIITMIDQLRNGGLTDLQIAAFYLLNMDLHAFLTRGESFGLPPLESAMLGVRTISTGIPPQKEIFKGSGVPLVKHKLFPMDKVLLYSPDEKDAKRKIEKCLESKSECEPKRDVLESRFSYRKIAEDLEKILEKALADPKSIAESF